jgi:putative hydrolase
VEQFPYDAHTHTVFSDGRNSTEENVRAAEAAGLRCVALTDHLLPETNHERVQVWAAEAERLDRESPVKVIIGVEGVILDTEGTVSVEPRDAAAVKLVLVDFGSATRGIGVDPPASMKRYEDNVLAAVENAANNPVVDAIAHPFNLGRFAAVLTPEQLSREGLRRVAKAMSDHNVAFEIMNQAHWWYPQMTVEEFTRDFVGVLKIFAREGVKFIVGSDAHSAGAVGNLQYCRHLMRAAGIELSQLVDLERMAAARS